jgi:hypothetical protein
VSLQWAPGFERHPGPVSGTYVSNAAWKIVIHTTEGSSIEGAEKAYADRNDYPHATIDGGRRRAVQHLPFDRPARALKHPAGGVETNNARTLQFELVGFAGQAADWSHDDLAWIGAQLAPVAAAYGVQLVSPPFYGDGCGWTLATATARQRLGRMDWLAFNGLIGHQHVPGNDHWDPGAFPVSVLLAAMGAPQLAQAPVVLGSSPGAPAPSPAPSPVRSGQAPWPLPVLAQGASGGWVVLLQRALGGLATDGKFGPNTARAVISAQHDARFAPADCTGVVNAATWAWAVLARFGVLRQGSTGVGVEIVQNYLGLRPGAGLDGVFGPNTAAGVAGVQVWGGLAGSDVDSVVGPRTRDVFARA